MRERPILFSGPMVRAILSGRKTVTRRVIAAFPAGRGHVQPLTAGPWEWSPDGGFDLGVVASVCPFGAPGDRLWVRETFAESVPGCEEQGGFSYRADHVDPRGDGPAHPMTWRPSIFMPRAVSRIALDVVSVRAERLQDITDEEIAAEGVDREAVMALCPTSWRSTIERLRPRGLWCAGWDRINGKRAPWEANPWVWRVEFRRCP